MTFNNLLLILVAAAIAVIAVAAYILFGGGWYYIAGIGNSPSSSLSFQGLSTSQQLESEISKGIENNNFNLSYSGGFSITLQAGIANGLNSSIGTISIPASYSISKYDNLLRTYTSINISQAIGFLLQSLGFLSSRLPGYTMPRIPALSSLIKLWDIYNGTGDIGCVDIGNGTGCQYTVELLNVSSIQQWSNVSNTSLLSGGLSVISQFGNASFHYIGAQTYEGQQCSLMSINESNRTGNIKYIFYGQLCFSDEIGLPLYYNLNIRLINYSDSTAIATLQTLFNSVSNSISPTGITNLPSGAKFTNLSAEFLGGGAKSVSGVSGFSPFTPTQGAGCSSKSGIVVPLRNDNNFNVTIWDIPGISPVITQSDNLSGNVIPPSSE